MLRWNWLSSASTSRSWTAERTSAGLSDGRLRSLVELTFSVIAWSADSVLDRLWLAEL